MTKLNVTWGHGPITLEQHLRWHDKREAPWFWMIVEVWTNPVLFNVGEPPPSWGAMLGLDCQSDAS